jgi:hypothetical protein
MEHDELEEFMNNELDMGHNIIPQWHRRANYIVGDKVRFDGAVYRCKKSHISNLRWNPASAKALWEQLSEEG